jgi:hypothetical protein
LEEIEEAEAEVVETSEDAISAAVAEVLVAVSTEGGKDAKCLVPSAATAEKIARYLSDLQTASRFIAVSVLKK